MKVTCTQSNLIKALNIISRFSASKTTTLPILNNILLSTDKGRLRLSATNLEIGITTVIGAKVEIEGSYSIPSRLFIDFISANSDPTISLELVDNSLILQSDNFKGNIKGLPASDFPLIPKIKSEKELIVNAKNLKTAISETVFACAIDETRPVLGGVYFRTEGNKLILVATDSYRLAEKTINLTKKLDQDFSSVIPNRTMSELARIIESEEEISIIVGENQIQFTLGETELVSRVVEGNYPDYQNIIPKNFNTTSEVSANDLKNVIKMASFFVRDEANNIRVKVASEEVLISSFSSQVGDSTGKVKAETQGDEIEVSFNAKYILDELNINPSERVELKFNDKNTAGMIKPKGKDDYIYIIMPLRIEE